MRAKINSRKKIILPRMNDVVRILQSHDVIKAGLFGSYARGEAKKKSDIDLLVKFKGQKSLLDVAALELQLEDKIGRKFDVLTYGAIHPSLKKTILSEEISIL